MTACDDDDDAECPRSRAGEEGMESFFGVRGNG